MAVTMTAAPLRDALVAVLEDAIAWREPDTEGCCDRDGMCGDHEADQDRADAMASILAEIREADDDKGALAVLVTAPDELLAEIAGATTDQDVRAAAITSGGEHGE